MEFGKPFNADTYIPEEIKKLVEKFNIKTIIETGTNVGNTTGFFAEVVDDVRSIEYMKKYYDIAVKRYKDNKKIKLYFGSSPQQLKNILPYCVRPILFYLDAHWYKYNPLLDEILTIAKYILDNSVIVIHDFKVPDKDFGYNKYSDGRDFDWNLIKSNVEKVYNNHYEYYYNDKANGSYRGIIYITPKGIVK